MLRGLARLGRGIHLAYQSLEKGQRAHDPSPPVAPNGQQIETRFLHMKPVEHDLAQGTMLREMDSQSSRDHPVAIPPRYRCLGRGLVKNNE